MAHWKGKLADWRYAEPSTLPFPRETVPSPIQQALWQRGLQDPKALQGYFEPSLQSLPAPYTLPDIEQALAKLHQALQQKWPIYVVADYDVDGTTAAALLADFFRAFGVSTYFIHLPDRFQEGYGVSNKAVEKAIREGYKLFITVDCGTKDGEALKKIKAAGLTVLVLDHHVVDEGEPYPPADAFVNPQRPDSQYPNPYLSAAALTYRVLQAYLERYGGPAELLEEGLELVALSLLADVMPLVGENRTLAYLGLQRLREGARPGLLYLMQQAGLTAGTLRRSRQVVFQLVPRLNAAGRLHHPRHAFYLLYERNEHDQLQKVAKYLSALNHRRQRLQEAALQEALTQLEERHPGLLQGGEAVPPALVAWSPGWSKGVVGLVAAKLTERFHRPAFVLRQEEALLTGSARSPIGVPLTKILKGLPRSYLLRYGGHERAAGLTLKVAHIEAFLQAVMQEAARYLPLRPTETLDAIVDVRVHALPTLAEWSERFEPVGPANEAPRFLLPHLRVQELQDFGCVLAAPDGRMYNGYLDPLQAPFLRQALSPSRSVAVVATPRLNDQGTVFLALRDVVESGPLTP
ncbi:MAG: single-stranded-DNA-specific exonuclease RecJ [Bacteroidetes bacterium]|nr:MAG: single-stranded-DNA-specific exonuclease RecJ [Bacteroidota bacterium]